jgi:epoxide hydrolase-like predicted phosphatase
MEERMTEKGRLIKAVIFDMGGVLLRTEDGSPRDILAEKYHLTRQELEALVFQSPHAILAEEGRLSEHEHWLAVAAGLKLNPADLPDFIETFWSGDRVDENLLRFIDGLRPSKKTGLLSNAWSGARASISRRFLLLEVFDESVFSAEVGMRKPSKAIFDLMLDRLGVDACEAVFVDDFAVNIEGARETGMHGILFKTAAQVVDEIHRILQE